MMSEDVYGRNLEKVVAGLNKAGVSAEIRGTSTSRFVFSRLNDRTVEISWAGDDGIFVEYWEGQEDRPSSREETVKTFEIATNKAIEWLQYKP